MGHFTFVAERAHSFEGMGAPTGPTTAALRPIGTSLPQVCCCLSYRARRTAGSHRPDDMRLPVQSPPNHGKAFDPGVMARGGLAAKQDELLVAELLDFERHQPHALDAAKRKEEPDRRAQRQALEPRCARAPPCAVSS